MLKTSLTSVAIALWKGLLHLVREERGDRGRSEPLWIYVEDLRLALNLILHVCLDLQEVILYEMDRLKYVNAKQLLHSTFNHNEQRTASRKFDRSMCNE